MLVITRREGEEVVIGSPEAPIGVVRIASIKGDRVRVAFEFPREVQVHRREVADQITADAAPARPGDRTAGRDAQNGAHPPTPAGREASAASRSSTIRA
ncbi:MAG: carbon storage regulator [Phycisphaerales bacterium]